jgi:hypothetical protein
LLTALCQSKSCSGPIYHDYKALYRISGGIEFILWVLIIPGPREDGNRSKGAEGTRLSIEFTAIFD